MYVRLYIYYTSSGITRGKERRTTGYDARPQIVTSVGKVEEK